MNKSLTSLSTSTPDNNRSIEYAITCSDATGQEEKFVFHQHTAPVSICQQVDLSSSSAKIQVIALMVDLVKTHDTEVLQARRWFCVECNRPATIIVHNPMSYLHLPKPRVFNLATPCCSNMICDASIRAHLAELMAVVGATNALL